MQDDIRAVYAGAGRFARVMPLLLLLPAVPELAQYIAEIHLGMYESGAAAHAVASGLRLEFGYAKVLALLLPGYWFSRYLAWGDARRAARPESPAVWLWLALFAWSGLVQAWALFGPGVGALLGLAGRPALIAGAAASLIESVIGVYLTAWTVAWPLGNARLGPIRSVGVMAGSFWRTLGYMVAGIGPLMAAHYALGLGAIGRPAWIYWPMLVLDAGVVAALAHCGAGSAFIATRRGDAASASTAVPLRCTSPVPTRRW